jgi:hypothetical protein
MAAVTNRNSGRTSGRHYGLRRKYPMAYAQDFGLPSDFRVFIRTLVSHGLLHSHVLLLQVFKQLMRQHVLQSEYWFIPCAVLYSLYFALSILFLLSLFFVPLLTSPHLLANSTFLLWTLFQSGSDLLDLVLRIQIYPTTSVGLHRA